MNEYYAKIIYCASRRKRNSTGFSNESACDVYYKIYIGYVNSIKFNFLYIILHQLKNPKFPSK